MSDLPTTPDREQQKADNNASRRQSGLEPLPRDREDVEDAGDGRPRSGESGSEGTADPGEADSEEE